MKEKLFKVKSPILKAKEGEVTFPISYSYNGGIVIKGEWYNGFKVGKPIIPKGFKLISIGVGLQLNSQPPLATMLLKKK